MPLFLLSWYGHFFFSMDIKDTWILSLLIGGLDFSHLWKQFWQYMWHFYSFVFTFHISTSIDCDFVSWRGCMAFLEKTWQEIAGKAVGNNIHVRYASILNAPSDFYFRFEQALGRSQALWMIDITAKLRWDKPLRPSMCTQFNNEILGHQISRRIIIQW